MVVTTEMAARGLDIAHLTHVVNYDLPTDADHYVHRAGRYDTEQGHHGFGVGRMVGWERGSNGEISPETVLEFDAISKLDVKEM